MGVDDGEGVGETARRTCLQHGQTVAPCERPELTGGGKLGQVVELRQMTRISGAQQ
ncbi:hypothetical protein D3C78_1758700 [compost metagenome]